MAWETQRNKQWSFKELTTSPTAHSLVSLSVGQGEQEEGEGSTQTRERSPSQTLTSAKATYKTANLWQKTEV